MLFSTCGVALLPVPHPPNAAAPLPLPGICSLQLGLFSRSSARHSIYRNGQDQCFLQRTHAFLKHFLLWTSSVKTPHLSKSKFWPQPTDQTPPGKPTGPPWDREGHKPLLCHEEPPHWSTEPSTLEKAVPGRAKEEPAGEVPLYPRS